MSGAKSRYHGSSDGAARGALRPKRPPSARRQPCRATSQFSRACASKLAAGVTWDQLAKLTPDQIKDRDIFPAGFLPLPHPNHRKAEALPKFEIDELKKQEDRDLTRFDLDFDTPDQFLPEFPAPIYLTTRPDLGDVSQGKLVTLDNYYETVQRYPQPQANRRSPACF